ncbi:MAG: glycosyltransferase family 2 protein [Conexivisphaerales archaeon]
MVRYSICITNYNTVNTIRDALEAITAQLPDDSEIVVVDNMSNDGSEKILKSYHDNGKIKLISVKCSRGKGRQIALTASNGEYVISGLDMDDKFNPSLQHLLRFYHDKCNSLVLAGAGEATIIAPRHILLELGGWRDLQFRENWELCRRAAVQGLYRWTIFPMVAESNPHPERKNLLHMLKYRYIRYRENLRVGHKIFDKNEEIGYSQKMILLVAKLSTLFMHRYQTNFSFWSVDPRYFIDSRSYWPQAKELVREAMLYRLLMGVNNLVQ